MRFVPFPTLIGLVLVIGCAHQWVYLTEGETTKYYLDAQSAVRSSGSTWEVRERFFDIDSNRWFLESDVQYDCVERTFMTLQVREFLEYRPVRHASVISGNVPVVVTPGSEEEARLQAVCAIVEGG